MTLQLQLKTMDRKLESKKKVHKSILKLIKQEKITESKAKLKKRSSIQNYSAVQLKQI